MYLQIFEKREDVHALFGRVVSVTAPANGTLTVWQEETGAYKYLPKSGFFGTDSATATVELDGIRIKIIFTFKVINSSIGGQLQTGMVCGASNVFRKMSGTYDFGEITFAYANLPGATIGKAEG